jgi:predicted thioesterase
MILEVGIYATTEVVVNDENTAMAVKSGCLPVFATPAMIAIMENAAVKCLAPYFDDLSTTVGTAINVEHTRASPVGTKIVATATLVEINGRELLFDVTACDSNGLIIGKGRHKRFVVIIDKFLNKIKD